jgi:hypothetical protein
MRDVTDAERDRLRGVQRDELDLDRDEAPAP